MKSIKCFTLFVCGLLLGFCSAAQNDSTISGFIYDLQSHQPLAGATIVAFDTKTTTLTDESGYFEINTDNDTGTLIISIIGYKKQTVDYNAEDHQLNIQMETDPISLNEIRVTSYGGSKTNKETAGSIAYISNQQLRQGNGVSLQKALNSVPGVRMSQSTLSESRISIRGNGVRSPWGIRDVKIYINDIPLTEADGTTRIEALDVNAIGSAEIIKGPASSIYGGGTGGVINFKLQRAPYQEQSLEASALTGSFGLRQWGTTYRNGGDKMNSYISYGWQQYKGYREHSSDMRRFLSGNFQLIPNEKQVITILLSRSTQHAQIPGSLNQQQVEENRRQANQDNVEKDAGRNQNWMRVGIGQQYRFSNHFTNATSIFTYFYDLDHPLPFAYIRSNYQSYGGRTKFDFDPGFHTLPTRFAVGMEFNQAHTSGLRYANDNGKEGAIIHNADNINTLYSLFFQSETHLSPKTTLVLGLSYNGLKYDTHDFLHPDRSGIKEFKAQASPRIALSHNFGSALSLHAGISSGYSPPTGTQISNVDGAINQELQAERGINFEIDAKGNLLHSRLAYDLALFKMDMKGELIGQSIQQGITVYHNSGKTTHTGVELALNYQLIKKDDGNEITSLRPYAAVTFSDFQFKEYRILDAQDEVKAIFDGNDLTGISPWVISAGINIESRVGIYFNGSYYFSDRLPLNDANTAYNPSYSTFDSKIGFKRRLSEHIGINIYGGINNILNARYSSMTSLNAVSFGGGQPPYFNPSPTRNGYMGLNIKYLF